MSDYIHSCPMCGIGKASVRINQDFKLIDGVHTGTGIYLRIHVDCECKLPEFLMPKIDPGFFEDIASLRLVGMQKTIDRWNNDVGAHLANKERESIQADLTTGAQTKNGGRL